MKKMGAFFALATLLSLCCFADEIVMKDGKSLKGFIVAEAEGEATVLLDEGGSAIVKKADIREITPSPSEEKAFAKAKFEIDKKAADAAEDSPEKKSAGREYAELAQKCEVRADAMKEKAAGLRRLAKACGYDEAQAPKTAEKPPEAKKPADEKKPANVKVWTLAEFKSIAIGLRPPDDKATEAQRSLFASELTKNYGGQKFKFEFKVSEVSLTSDKDAAPSYRVECESIELVKNKKTYSYITVAGPRIDTTDPKAGKLKRGSKLVCTGTIAKATTSDGDISWELSDVEAAF